MSAPVAWWVCRFLHPFRYGDQDWHAEFARGWTGDFPIPTYCHAEPGGFPCLDSAHLRGPFPHEGAARRFIRRELLRSERDARELAADPPPEG